ncbi:MAG: hypothetical protein GX657_16115 [Chloroflexi bacterium]|jgi:hypothetical protein|nr:hypothetical protein [Chloroflexota bacterium]
MNQNRERVAWIVLWSAFLFFCVLAVAVPLGARAYVRNAVRREKAVVESLAGTVVVEPAVGSGATPLGKGGTTVISEGTVVRVDETSEAVITFFDFSNLHLARGTTVRIDRMRAPRYRWGVGPSAIAVSLLGGRVHIGTALALESPLDFGVTTTHAQTTLAADGSYVLDVTNERTDVTANRGEALVTAQGQSVGLGARQRTLVTVGQSPHTPTDSARDLLVDGDLQTPLSEVWTIYNDQGNDGGDVDGSVEGVVDDRRRAVRFLRIGGTGNHCETVIEQRIDREVNDMSSLVLRANVKVRHQSLSGGGYLSSEFPLMVRITYRDAYDSQAEWVHGFYYQNDAGNPTTYGQEIAKDQWFPFESPNLLELLPRPYRIVAIRIYASGWDYDSLIADVSLIAE